jgi:hypothetical protein
LIFPSSWAASALVPDALAIPLWKESENQHSRPPLQQQYLSKSQSESSGKRVHWHDTINQEPTASVGLQQQQQQYGILNRSDDDEVRMLQFAIGLWLVMKSF